MLRFILISLLVSGCAIFKNSDVSGRPLDPQKKAQQEKELLIAQSHLEQDSNEKALELFQKFKVQFIGSPLYVKAVFGEAQSLEKLGRWSEAIVLYRETIELTRFSQPELAAEALFLSSFCYEALGDEIKVQTSLRDALNLKDYLSAATVQAEIPARLAASYYRSSQSKLAFEQLELAEKGVLLLKGGNQLWAAKTYFHMGLLSYNQISSENFQSTVETLRIVQRFSLKAVELGQAIWSAKASEGLKNNYMHLLQVLKQESPNKTLEFGASQRELSERKKRMAKEIIMSINQLRQMQLPEENNNEYVKNLFSYMEGIELDLLTLLYSQKEMNELTPSSESRSGLKRKYKLIEVK